RPDDALEGAGADGVVAGEVDRGDAGAFLLVDDEGDADTAVAHVLDARRDGGVDVPLRLVREANALCVCGNDTGRGNAAGRHIDHGEKLRVGETLVPLEE